MTTLYETNISLKEDGHAMIDLEWATLMTLIDDYKFQKTAIQEYRGFHRDYEHSKDIIRWAIAFLRPCDIISITADEIPVESETPTAQPETEQHP